jgi:hypothetical protein
VCVDQGRSQACSMKTKEGCMYGLFVIEECVTGDNSVVGLLQDRDRVLIGLR